MFILCCDLMPYQKGRKKEQIREQHSSTGTFCEHKHFSSERILVSLNCDKLM